MHAHSTQKLYCLIICMRLKCKRFSWHITACCNTRKTFSGNMRRWRCDISIAMQSNAANIEIKWISCQIVGSACKCKCVAPTQHTHTHLHIYMDMQLQCCCYNVFTYVAYLHSLFCCRLSVLTGQYSPHILERDFGVN